MAARESLFNLKILSNLLGNFIHLGEDKGFGDIYIFQLFEDAVLAICGDNSINRNALISACRS